ncbi:sensor histidine kinase [Rhizorhapis sp. SPR117]|uniref:sensor histidine kinase n=1 Tax=Rhizorhapis sp. SPR117 TaxID=2912611 RepID=UPI001F2350B7|nr:sensor histidine kinase [Rhizorhapis sp. SPR117]
MAMTSETRLSTGVKMFLILTLALLPLGLIALFASLQASRTADLEKAALLNVAANESARNLVAEIAANGAALRVVVNALAANRQNTGICARADEILRKRDDARVDFIIHDRQSDAPLCASDPNLVLNLPGNNPFGADPADILPKQKRLIVRTLSGDGQLVAIAIYNVSHLERITGPATALQNHQIALIKGGAQLVVGSTLRPRASGDFNRVRTPVGNAGIDLLLTVRDPPVNIARSLSVFLPLLMWVAAAGIGWFVVNRLLIFPLIQLRRLVSDYQPGEVLEPLRKMPTPAQEIRDLGNTFRAITQTVADHESELAASLDRQTRLTREVHHRVKNNLQIIASLINLHSRAAPTQEAADAYASIQRRVDALSVVHRNHYAELEEHRGVGIRSLVSELSVALGSSMPDDAPNMAIQVNSDHLFVSQDVAVPIAFLITELAEMALLVDARAAIRISVRVGESVRQGDSRPRAILRVQSSALKPSEQMTQYLDQRFGRILTGLSRQLRSHLDYDPDKGEYAIAISLCE